VKNIQSLEEAFVFNQKNVGYICGGERLSRLFSAMKKKKIATRAEII